MLISGESIPGGDFSSSIGDPGGPGGDVPDGPGGDDPGGPGGDDPGGPGGDDPGGPGGDDPGGPGGDDPGGPGGDDPGGPGGDDPPNVSPRYTIAPASADEGDDLNFRVNGFDLPDQGIWVDVMAQFEGNPPNAGTGFARDNDLVSAGDVRVHLTPEDSEKWVTFTAAEDAFLEQTEVFYAQGDELDGWIHPDDEQRATGTIRDTTTGHQVSVSGFTTIERTPSDTPAIENIQFSLTPPPDTDQSLTVFVRPVNNPPGEDPAEFANYSEDYVFLDDDDNLLSWSSQGIQLVFTSQQNVHHLRTRIHPDYKIELDEKIALEIQSPEWSVVTPDNYVVGGTILNDDIPYEASVQEGASIEGNNGWINPNEMISRVQLDRTPRVGETVELDILVRPMRRNEPPASGLTDDEFNNSHATLGGDYRLREDFEPEGGFSSGAGLAFKLHFDHLKGRSRDIPFEINGDLSIERNEFFVVEIVGGRSLQSGNLVDVTTPTAFNRIDDDDVVYTVSLGSPVENIEGDFDPNPLAFPVLVDPTPPSDWILEFDFAIDSSSIAAESSFANSAGGFEGFPVSV
ncbi:MAG: hypothetical protein AAFP90_10265 [Planctomycetota bacterium]